MLKRLFLYPLPHYCKPCCRKRGGGRGEEGHLGNSILLLLFSPWRDIASGKKRVLKFEESYSIFRYKAYFDKSIYTQIKLLVFCITRFPPLFPQFYLYPTLVSPLFADIKEEEKGQRIFTAAAFLPFPSFFSLSDPFSISSSLFSRRR